MKYYSFVRNVSIITIRNALFSGGEAFFIITDKQLQSNRGFCLPMQAMLPEGFPFSHLDSGASKMFI